MRCAVKEPLTAGRHVLTFLVDKGGFCVKSLTFKSVPTSKLPGVVEAEDFAGSLGVDVISGNGGFVLGNTDKGDWMEYSVDVTQAGKYSYEATVSSDVDGSSFKMVMVDSDGNEKTLASVSVPNTGSKDTYQVKTGKIRNAISEGRQKLLISITGAGCNIDKVNFVCTDPATGISELTDDDAATGASYNLAGQQVGVGYKGIVIRNGKKVIKNK